MLKRKSFALVVLLLALTLVAAACASDDTADSTSSPAAGDTATTTGLLKEVMDRGTIRVATDPAYPPQSELNSKTGEYEGFDIDVANEIAKRMGVTVEWVTPSWDLLTAGGWNDRWDISVGSMTVTPERAQVLHFTPPYYYTPAAVAVYEDNTTINDVATDLDGKKIGVCAACTYDLYLQGTLNIPGETIDFVVDNADVKTYDTDSTAIQDLTLGDGQRLDAVISAMPTLETAIAKGKPIKITGNPVFYEPLAVALDRKASEDPAPLLEKISAIIEEMHADGTLTTLSNKWYGTDLTTKVEV